VIGLKSAAGGLVAAAATFGGFLSYDVFMSPAELWIKIAVGVAWAAAVAGAGFFVNSVQKNRVWAASKGAAEVIKVEQARRRKDYAALDRIGLDARARRERMAALLKQAKRKKSKTVANKTNDSVALAERYMAFDLLVSARADLNENIVSKDPASRIGGQLPETWKAWLQTDEAAAIESGFEGDLAVRLKKMSEEAQTQEANGRRVSDEIGAYEGVIPKLFGGRMGGEAERARKDHVRYEKDELKSESALYDTVNGAMRKRVSDKLYEQSPEFAKHRDRFDALKGLYDGPLTDATDTARFIDDKLSSAISHLNSQQTYLALAAANKRVAVTRTDANGRRSVSYEDHSGPYRAMAAAEGLAASSAASAAQEAFGRMPGLIVNLHNDHTMGVEGLRDRLPHASAQSVDAGSVLWTTWVMPPLFGLFSSMGSASAISSTRSSFRPIMNQLNNLAGEVASRRDGEDQWVNARIDEDLAEQMTRARNE
ncbi:MAG: hypothetical protein HYZ74_00300, partial [Elusimicrobia bacterium]|nr:hypothetical protein [Elusimicrobiota bacterium]